MELLKLRRFFCSSVYFIGLNSLWAGDVVLVAIPVIVVEIFIVGVISFVYSLLNTHIKLILSVLSTLPC